LMSGSLRELRQAAALSLASGGSDLFKRAAHKAKSTLTLIDDTEFNDAVETVTDRKSTRLNSSHVKISYAVFCLKKEQHSLHAAVLWRSGALKIRSRLPRSTLFPYTTLFRSFDEWQPAGIKTSCSAVACQWRQRSV